MNRPKNPYDVREIKLARLRRSWTKSELARRVGVSVPIIHRVESGVNRSPKTIKKIADELGIQLMDLLS